MNEIGNIRSNSQLEQLGSAILLVGTKSDLERKVTEESLDKVAEEFNVPWIETR